jgi:hypothetical protein
MRLRFFIALRSVLPIALSGVPACDLLEGLEAEEQEHCVAETEGSATEGEGEDADPCDGDGTGTDGTTGAVDTDGTTGAGDTDDEEEEWEGSTGDWTTPLVLSFDATPVGVEPAPIAAFDNDGLGRCLTTDWPATVTPWLALDLDQSGTVDSGRELFGSGTRLPSGGRASNGFEALAALDSDRNGKIDGADERFADLVLWADQDGDKRGILAEMDPLAARGIIAIDLGYRVDPVCDARGNCAVERAKFQFIDRSGTISTGEVGDLHRACQ